MKVTIVGAGNVGATCADSIAYQGMASEVVLLDIKEGFAEGKALDMMQTATTLGFNTKIVGTTSDYKKTANSDVVVITSGVPRKPGMTREELIGINAGIVKSVARSSVNAFTKDSNSGCVEPYGYDDLSHIKSYSLTKAESDWYGWSLGQQSF